DEAAVEDLDNNWLGNVIGLDEGELIQCKCFNGYCCIEVLLFLEDGFDVMIGIIAENGIAKERKDSDSRE
ncbi:hypothetical protein Tco_1513264, partial [Tanacetum coccineum]